MEFGDALKRKEGLIYISVTERGEGSFGFCGILCVNVLIFFQVQVWFTNHRQRQKTGAYKPGEYSSEDTTEKN